MYYDQTELGRKLSVISTELIEPAETGKLLSAIRRDLVQHESATESHRYIAEGQFYHSSQGSRTFSANVATPKGIRSFLSTADGHVIAGQFEREGREVRSLGAARVRRRQ